MFRAKNRLFRLSRTSWLFLSRFLSTLNHPVIIFVGLQIAWIGVMLLWVFWFVNQYEAIANLRHALGDSKIGSPYDLAILALGCTLLGIILFGMMLLFIFIQKQRSLLRQQRSFVSSITHELKSPLASLQLSIETLQRSDLPEEVEHKLVKMAEGDIERLVRLVNRILLSGQIDRGVFDFGAKNELFNMVELLDSIKMQTIYMDINLDKRLKVMCDPNLCVRNSKMAMSLIIGNLLENAVKYSPLGKPIEIEIKQEHKDLVIRVKDEGFGLLKKDLKKIFRMFYRSSLATKKALPGAGLGLYLIKSTVKILGGTVWANSKGQNKGATFYVVIPHRPLS